MESPFDILNKASDESLSEKMTLQQWLEWLIELRDELSIKISATQNDIKNSKKNA